MKKGITIFTPTYNRAYTLERIYNSLKKQKNTDFEWLIVDDGSTDNTKEVVSKWIQEKNINLRYYYQENAGKMQAHNKGVELAKYELFCCVDSDDYLTNNAIDIILKCWEMHKNDDNIIGILDFKFSKKGQELSSGNLNNVIGRTCTLDDAYRKFGLRGDAELIYRTEIIKRFSFPSFKGEKFVPEVYLYDQLDRVGKLYVQGKKLFVCEYLPDGYTASMKKTIHDNPCGYEAYITQRLSIVDKRLSDIAEDAIRYVAIEKCRHTNDMDIIKNSPHKIITTIMIPFGKLFFHLAYKKYE